MGVRVHKTIGFGAREFVPPAGFQERLEEASERTTLGDFATWCRAHEDEIRAFAPGARDKFRRTMLGIDLNAFAEDGKVDVSLGKYVEWANEFGFKDAIVFAPPGWPVDQWKRYNDNIDWCEDTQLHGQERRWVPLDREIEPFLKGKPPLTIAALCLWLGVPEMFGRLHEVLYVYWG